MNTIGKIDFMKQLIIILFTLLPFFMVMGQNDESYYDTLYLPVDVYDYETLDAIEGALVKIQCDLDSLFTIDTDTVGLAILRLKMGEEKICKITVEKSGYKASEVYEIEVDKLDLSASRDIVLQVPLYRRE